MFPFSRKKRDEAVAPPATSARPAGEPVAGGSTPPVLPPGAVPGQIALLPFGEPRNVLERAMQAKQARQIEIVQFLNILLQSQVWLVTGKDQLEAVDGPVRLVSDPMLYSQTLRGVPHLAVFTDAERARMPKEMPPGMDCAIPFKFVELFRMFFQGNQAGVIINPFFEGNMSWNPEQLAEIGKGIRG